MVQIKKYRLWWVKIWLTGKGVNYDDVDESGDDGLSEEHEG